MDLAEVLADLERQGTEANRRATARHGVFAEMYGVSFTALRNVAKRIGRDDALAVALWDTANHDARILATMVLDERTPNLEMLRRWASECDSYIQADAVSSFLARTNVAQECADLWADEEHDFVGQIAWNLVAQLAARGSKTSEDWYRAKLDVIGAELQKRGNRTRHAMNGALIAIGIAFDALRDRALAVAAQVGRVEVDHGLTGNRTPEAGPSIRRSLVRKAPSGRAGDAEPAD
jgi:3-methyladenine DNA glycosylase AlkD